jgi:hypothetical protein
VASVVSMVSIVSVVLEVVWVDRGFPSVVSISIAFWVADVMLYDHFKVLNLAG